MLVTQEPSLRNFWYPVVPAVYLKSGPRSFTLLGEKIALWQDSSGRPAALQDRCCHRSAQLSKGWVQGDTLYCPYHAWGYGADGKCVHLPQTEGKPIPAQVRVPGYHCQEKYGYVWVCLGEPLRAIPEFPEASDPSYRSFPCFYETWKTSSMRVIENELDMSHFAVVHRGTFGNPEVPLPLSSEIQDIDAYTLHLSASLSVRPTGAQIRNTREARTVSTRQMDVTWYLPFTIRLGLSYPSGLRHIIINHPTPVDDSTIQVVQFCFRNDRSSEVSESEILAFERKILDEDRSVLETCDPDVPLTADEAMHLITDKPGLLARRKLQTALHPEHPRTVELGHA